MSILNSVSKVALAAILISTSISASAQDEFGEDEIVVTGARILTGSPDDAITGVSILAGEELENRLAATIGETLKNEPGVSSSFFGAGASRPIIRGQGGDRIRVLTNGIGSIDASSASPDHAVAAEPAQAERIEVLRGASLLRFGSSGAGGVVNVIDGRIPQAVPDDAEIDLRFSASSVDNGAELAGSMNQSIGENFVLHLDGTWREANDYRIPGFAESEILHEAEEEEHEGEDHDDEDHDEEREGEAFGRLDNSDLESYSLTGGLSYVGDRGFIGVSLHSFNSRYGVPGGHGHEDEHDHEEEHEDDDDDDHEEEEEELVSIDLEQTRLDLNAVREFDGFIERVQLFGGYADYTHTELEGDEIGTVFANEGWETRLEAIQAENDGWKAAYGIQIRNRDFSAVGAEAFVPPTKTTQLGVYTFQEKELGELHLEGAARFEMTEHENSLNSQSKDFDLFSVSGGGDYHISNKIRFGATVFRTERAPTSEELFSNGPHLATSAFEVGNPDLNKETATGAEVSYRHRGDDHFVTANLFYTDYDGYIFERMTGAEEDGLDVFEFAADDATFRGGEIQAGFDVGMVGDIEVSVDGLAEYVRAKTDNGNLPRIPPLSLLAGIDANWDDFSFRAETEYAAKQDKISAEELPTDDYTQVNMFLTWAPETEKDIKFKLSALNLLDSEARQHTSFLKDVVPLPGRNFRFSVDVGF
ncbi:MAG: TonB-dependent receptor [Hellea sp.]|nr:TonB-dependent receptor [Hellea sp.]